MEADSNIEELRPQLSAELEEAIADASLSCRLPGKCEHCDAVAVLAQRVVDDAALLREVREALEARSRAYHELHPGHFSHPDSPTASYNACTNEPCVGDRTALAKLREEATK